MRPIRLPHRTQVAGIAAVTLLLGACASAGSGGLYGAPAAGTTAPASGAVAGATAAPAAGAGGTSSVTINMASAGSVGTVLTGADGRTLYVFHKDGPNRTACTGGCASTWPPLTVTSATAASAGSGVKGSIGTFARPDGSLQVTFDGAPLYYYSGDMHAGDANGQGIGGLWFAATGAPAAAAPSPSSSSRYSY